MCGSGKTPVEMNIYIYIIFGVNWNYIDISPKNGEEPIGHSKDMWRLSHPFDLEMCKLPSC